MGVLASTMRLMTLTAQITEDEEFYNDLDPQSPTARSMATEKKRLNQLEKKLEVEQKALQTRLQQVLQEMQACQQMLGADIQSGMFSYGMGMGR